MFRFKKAEKGFTLIELLVVIAIIGILSSIVLASLNTARQKSRDAKRVSDVRQLQLAFELFFDSCRQYPTGVNGTMPTTGTANGCTSPTTLGSFIPAIPIPPSGAGLLVYSYHSGTATTYCLGAELEQASAVPSGDTNCDADGTGSGAWGATSPANAFYSVTQ
jgi:prepilin-type N-terminal cleavage/methylation domain-containing protein